MLTPEQLAAYFENRLEPVERTEVERALAEDAAAQYALADQLNLDLALRVLLGRHEAHERVKASIFTVLSGAPEASLAAGILRDASSATERRPHAGFTDADLVPPASHGSRTVAPAGAWGRHWARAWRRLLDSPWRWGIASAVALVVVVWTLAGMWPIRPAVGPEIGQFHVVVGEPTLAIGSGRAPLPAQVSTAVHLGDRVETGDADRAEIHFLDGTTLRLAFNTTVEFTAPSGQLRGTPNALLRPPEVRLLQGQVWSQVAKRTNAPTYAIRTDAATAIARGTEFGVRLQRVDATAMNSPLATVLTVKEGAVDFTNALGSVRATAMTECRAQVGSAPTEPKRLQTLQVVHLPSAGEWSILSSALDWPEVADRLAQGGGWAGVRLGSPPPPDQGTNAARNAPTAPEIRVLQVKRGSPADAAGLKPGDVVVRLDGAEVTHVAQVQGPILQQPGASLALRVRRGGTEQDVRLTATSRSPLLPAPTWSSDDRGRLDEEIRAWMVGEVGGSGGRRGGNAGSTVSGPTPLVAAIWNNRGVLAELHDAMGPAIRAYRRAVATDSSVVLYRYNLGLALRKIGSFERAAEELQEASRLASTSVEAQKRLAELLSLLGDSTNALARTESALALAANDHGLWELKAQLLGKLLRPEEAVDAARRAVATEPGCPVALGYLGGAYQRLGRWAEAEQSYRQAVELAPFEASMHMNLGVVLRDRGQFRPAEQALRRAIELRPDFSLPYNNLGDLLASRGQYAPARTAFEKAAELDPADLSAKLSLGRLALIQGRNDEAEARFREVLDASPHHVEALQALANVLAMKRNLPETERLLRLARDIAPDSAGVHNDLGEVLRLRGRAEEALQSYRRALALEPDNVNPMNNIAILQAMRGEHAEAEQMFRKLVERAATDRRLYPLNFLINLAMVCGKQGKIDEAEKYYRQALRLQPEDAGLGSSFAYFLAEHRRHLGEALTLARRAVQVAPNEFNYLDNLGWVLFQRGELEEAEKVLQKAVDLAGQDPAAPEIREHLRKAREQKRAVKE